jgi:hypothetical protein
MNHATPIHRANKVLRREETPTPLLTPAAGMTPQAIREVFLDRVHDFGEGAFFLRFLKPALGEALLTA